jgi:GGDEF domain-containing protein
MAQIMAVVGPDWYAGGMPEAPFGARRPRPVADVPPAALADGQAAAKGWLLGLLAARPLRDAVAVPTEELAREAPGLCAAVLRAVGSDADLPRLQAGGDLVALAAATARLAGARDPAAVVTAVGALRAALWEALVATMGPLDQPTTAALAERLAHVCDMVALAALGAAPAERPAPFHVQDTRRPHLATVPEPDTETWSEALARGLERHGRDGEALSLLAVEVDDAERLLAADADGAAAGALAGAEQAVRGELRPGDVLGRDDDGRLWIVAAELGATGGRALAERLADAVAAAAPLRGAPLTVSIGLASCPGDATEADALVGLAEERLFAARAAGVPIA